jgi:uncharacterized protein (TIGR03067 family)
VTRKSAHNDLERLQGTWSVRTLELDGQQTPEAMLGDTRIEVKGDRFTTSGMGATYFGKLALDTSTNPPHIEMHFEAGPENGHVNLGIYELDGDTWKICLSTRGTDRPSRFATSPGTGFALETLTRGERNGRSTHTSSVETLAAKPSKNGGPTVFEGRWKMLSGMADGSPMEALAVRWVTRSNVGHNMEVHAGPRLMLRASFVYDPTQSPKTIDYFFSEGPNKGKTQLAIYEIENDQLKVCAAAPDQPRPTEFRSVPGRNWTLTLWKRKR